LKKFGAEKILSVFKKSEKYFEKYKSYNEIKKLKKERSIEMKTLIMFLSKACPRVGSGNKYKVFVSLTFLVIGFLMAIPCFGQTRFEVEFPSILDVLVNKATVVVTIPCRLMWR